MLSFNTHNDKSFFNRLLFNKSLYTWLIVSFDQMVQRVSRMPFFATLGWMKSHINQLYKRHICRYNSIWMSILKLIFCTQLDWLLVLMLVIILVDMIVLKHVVNLWHILMLVQVMKTQGASFHDVWKISSCCIVAPTMANNGFSPKVINLSLHRILVKDLSIWISNLN
jgi:hypothetical protein